MARHRDIAASPVRTAVQTWAVITDLVVASLVRAAAIDGSGVQVELEDVGVAAHALIAAGYTDRADITVVADPLYLTIRTGSGDSAFSVLADENLNPVPGAATADTWTLYLPRPEGLGSLIDDVINGVAHVSSRSPPTERSANGVRVGAALDLRRLDPRQRT